MVASGAPLPTPKLVEPGAKFLQYGKMALGLVPNGGVLGVCAGGGGEAFGGGDLGGGERGGGGGGLVIATGGGGGGDCLGSGGGERGTGGGGLDTRGGGGEAITTDEPTWQQACACSTDKLLKGH